jgi:hypothetical protein
MKSVAALILLLPFLAVAQDNLKTTAAPYREWRHTGELAILTTAEGANLPAATVVEGFPLLVRLHKDWFDFKQAKAGGEDIRFSSNTAEALAYQVEEWDAENGTASIWVRIPRIGGNARQTIRMHWGMADAAGESSGRAVFNESNGYLSVWHMGDAVADEVGTLESKDVDTTATAGMVGKARHFAGKQGIFCGDKITSYPSADAPHTTEAWFRAERPNVTIIGWGNEGGGRGSKVRMQLRSPPHLRIDSDFSDVKGESRLPMGEWIHVVHTYGGGPRRIYINGVNDGEATTKLDIKNPARLWLGGWYHNYDFVGDLDEVRISKVARTADWVRLEFENQKPLQTLVGPVIQPGSVFAVSPLQATVMEGKNATFTAQAGGAEKIYWVLKRDGREAVVATDRFAFSFDAGRVIGDSSATLQCRAVYPDGVKVGDIAISVKEAIPEPVFTLKAPAAWDGRATIEVVPQFANLGAMQAAGAGDLKMEWSVAPFAVIKQALPGKLILQRAQNSGRLVVTGTASNGGQRVTQTAIIAVTEPQRDAWVGRTPARDEKPEDGQFYARDDKNEGTLFYNGTLADAANSVFLKLYADDKLVTTKIAKPEADKSYAFAVKLKPGLIKYRIEFGADDKVLHTVGNLVCGDAFLLNGQSNAVATDWGKEEPPAFHSEWIRTFGTTSGSPKGERIWGEATYRSPGGKLQIGYWAMELAKGLVESQKVPVCILNGAVGGTRIDQHQRNPNDPTDMTTIYGRLLWRAREARLTHGIRGVMWHQGENDQGADGPTGGYGWENYRQFFIDLAAAWKQDFPNIQHYHVFQIWPKSCAMGVNGSDNRLREVQRNLPTAFSKMSIMSTLGIEPPGGCHYPPAGYVGIAKAILPLIERDHYGRQFATSITPPNLTRAYFTSDTKDEVVMEFDQPVKWDDTLATQFYLDREAGRVASGTVAGNVVTLKLATPSNAKIITYLDSKEWSQKTLLRGENGIAALTFCEVPLSIGRAGH